MATNYKIGIVLKKNELRIIELGNSELKNLKFLDKLTLSFSSEEELKEYLLTKNLISTEEINKKIKIVYKYNGEYKKLPVIYKNCKKYFDIQYLRYIILSFSNDLEFLKKIANHYSIGSAKFNLQGDNVYSIRNYIHAYNNNMLDSDSVSELNESLEDLIAKAISNLNTKTGEYTDNYRGLRDLVLFVFNYEELKRLKTIKNNIEQESLLKEKKTKNDSRKEVWQQLSILDMEDNLHKNKKWILSSEGEPDFPPNSDEEAMYIKYLEKLERESFANNESDHYKR